MPHIHEYFDQIKAVERELRIVAEALLCFQSGLSNHQFELPTGTSARDLVVATARLEATYLIRMWASFEMALRSYHRAQTGQDGIKAKNLVEWAGGLKQGLSISEAVRNLIHEVRIDRNSLVHGQPAPAIAIDEARRRLNSLLHRLPLKW